jgi:hypothetical protein
MSVSRFDRVSRHLQTMGESEPMEHMEDLENIVRRCDDVRSMGADFGEIELSPYVQSLLRVTRAARVREDVLETRLVVSV